MAKKKKVAGGIGVALILIIAVVAVIWITMDEDEPMTYTCTDNGGMCRDFQVTSSPNAGDCTSDESMDSSLTCPSGQTCCVAKTCAAAGGTCRAMVTTSAPNAGDCNAGETFNSALTCPDSANPTCCVPEETGGGDTPGTAPNACTDAGNTCVDFEATNDNSCAAMGLNYAGDSTLDTECGDNKVCCS